jgi:hypothetical protein
MTSDQQAGLKSSSLLKDDAINREWRRVLLEAGREGGGRKEGKIRRQSSFYSQVAPKMMLFFEFFLPLVVHVRIAAT